MTVLLTGILLHNRFGQRRNRNSLAAPHPFAGALDGCADAAAASGEDLVDAFRTRRVKGEQFFGLLLAQLPQHGFECHIIKAEDFGVQGGEALRVEFAVVAAGGGGAVDVGDGAFGGGDRQELRVGAGGEDEDKEMFHKFREPFW